MLWILALSLCLTIILGTLTTIPIIVAVILCFTVVFKNPWVFLAGILGGLFIDLFYLRILGSTSLFLVIFTFMVFLYQRRFEIQTLPFVFLACFVGSLLYLLIFDNNKILMQALINACIGVLLFKFVIPRVKMSP